MTYNQQIAALLGIPSEPTTKQLVFRLSAPVEDWIYRTYIVNSPFYTKHYAVEAYALVDDVGGWYTAVRWDPDTYTYRTKYAIDSNPDDFDHNDFLDWHVRDVTLPSWILPYHNES